MSDYISPNFTNPLDVRRFMRHLHVRPMAHSCGHNVASDFADYPVDYPIFGLYKKCGMLTLDESNIIYEFAKQIPGGRFFDIGAHTGLSTMTLASAKDSTVFAIDPMFAVDPFFERFLENTQEFLNITTSSLRSDQVLDQAQQYLNPGFDGAIIDGDHCEPFPRRDVVLVDEFLRRQGFIVLHDAWGEPVWSVAGRLKARGFQTRFYSTPHGLIAAWRGDLTPPDHTPDPRVDWNSKKRAQPGFPWR